MTKKLKFVKAQHPAGAPTSAAGSTSTKRKSVGKTALIGGALLAAGAGALAVLRRRTWPAIKKKAGELKDQADHSTADLREKATHTAVELREKATHTASELLDQAEKVAADFKEQAEKVVADLKDKAATITGDADGAEKKG